MIPEIYKKVNKRKKENGQQLVLNTIPVIHEPWRILHATKNVCLESNDFLERFKIQCNQKIFLRQINVS